MYFPKPEMDFNVKKLVRDAGTALSRVVQVLSYILQAAERLLGGVFHWSFVIYFKLQIFLATYFVYAKAPQVITNAMSRNKNKTRNRYKLAPMTNHAENYQK